MNKHYLPVSMILFLFLFSTCSKDESNNIVGVTNHRPGIVSITFNSDTILPTETITITSVASDVDGDLLFYAWSSEDGTFPGSTNENIVQWTTPEEPGDYTVYLSVSDGQDSIVQNITITVSDPPVVLPNNRPTVPTAANPIPNSETRTDNLLLNWECSDPDGDILLYNIFFGNSSPAPLVSSMQNNLYYDPGALVEGEVYYWKIAAVDSRDAVTVSPEWSFTVGKAEEQIFELGNTGVMIEMAWVPAGSFRRGNPNEIGAGSDEVPVREVTFDSGFWMGKYEVTQDQWEIIMGNWNFSFNHAENLPAENMSYNEITQFLTRLNNIDGEDVWRLPSEAEWEYVCKAGHYDTRFWWGDDNAYSQLTNYAWYNGNSGQVPHQVGTTRVRKPNPWGFWDMMGNIYEICEDYYHYEYQTAPVDGSPQTVSYNNTRSMRGGAWFYESRRCRPALRSWIPSNGKANMAGFRLVRNP